MYDDRDRSVTSAQPEAEQAEPPLVPQSESAPESEPIDLLLEERSTPELRRWLRGRYQAVAGG